MISYPLTLRRKLPSQKMGMILWMIPLAGAGGIIAVASAECRVLSKDADRGRVVVESRAT